MAARLSSQQFAEFDRTGVLRLPGFLSAADAAIMADAVWADLGRRFGARRDRSETWPQGGVHQFQDLVRSGAFDRLAPLLDLAGAFLGETACHPAKTWGLPLVTFPTPSAQNGAWDVPHAAWHLDLPASDFRGLLPAIRTFAFLEPVEPGGGGTLYVAGSHQAVLDRARQARRGEPLRSADMRSALKAEEPWLAALLQPGGEDRARRFMSAGGTLHGRPVRVEEMTGAPGDVIIMHPAMFHAGAPNGLDRPRMMLVETFYREKP